MQGRKLTNAEKAQFLKKLVLTGGNVSKASQVVKISRRAAYLHKESDKSFSDAWDEAIELGIDSLLEEAYKRAGKGVKKPIVQGGKVVCYVRETSDNLLKWLVEAKRPDHRRHSIHDINIDVKSASDAELEALVIGKMP